MTRCKRGGGAVVGPRSWPDIWRHLIPGDENFTRRDARLRRGGVWRFVRRTPLGIDIVSSWWASRWYLSPWAGERSIQANSRVGACLDGSFLRNQVW